ncbi:hypothetical protein [Streptomyces sp. NPDC051636]|uniref:hypothetical protein n=1 Tax=Streptomyces sp. NPDC051636 TaxID=3365663 RepID=UPI0037BB564A
MHSEDDGALDGVVAALAEGRRHGVRGVAEEGGPAAVEGGQRLGEVVDVVPEDVFGRAAVATAGIGSRQSPNRRSSSARSSSGARSPAGAVAAAYAYTRPSLSGWVPHRRPRPQVSCEANRAPGTGITTRQVVNPAYTGPG